MARDLPPGLVARPQELENVIGHLLAEGTTRSTALSTTLRGAGGMGKSTLAHLVCVDTRIRSAYPDGILWVTLGESANPAAELAAIHCALAESKSFAGLSEAVQAVGKLVGDRQFLLVIDDVWKRSDTRPFFGWGKRCARLLTTRNVETLPPGTHRVDVDCMRAEESVAILGQNLPGSNLSEKSLGEFATFLGNWPLLLSLVNAALVRRIEDGLSVEEALAEVKEELRAEGLDTLDLTDDDSRETSVARTMEVAQKALTEIERERYTMLGVFPEDVVIPIDVLATLWGTNTSRTKKLCRRLADVSLVQVAGATGVQLHDVIRKYLRGQLGEAGCRAVVEGLLHDILESIESEKDVWCVLGKHNAFIFSHLRELLQANFLLAPAYQLVTDVGFLEIKAVLIGRYAVEQDIEAVTEAVGGKKLRVLQTLKRAVLRGNSVWFGALGSQIHTAMVCEGLDLEELRGSLPRLAACFPAQTPDEAERVLCGHREEVLDCVVLEDGHRLVSASFDNTLRVWDADTGETEHILKGHETPVVCCAVLRDDRIVSASWDNTLRVWNTRKGSLEFVLEGHTNLVSTCIALGDGRHVVSASGDKTLRVWDTRTGETKHVLEGHTSGVRACTALGDCTHVVSASRDKTLGVWNARTGELKHVLRGHDDRVLACAVLADGFRVVSASKDATLRIWDTRTGEQEHILSGHEGPVNTCKVLPDGRTVVSGSDDSTLRVWDARSGATKFILEGHTRKVVSCEVLGDGHRIISTANDLTVRVWNTQTGQLERIFTGHFNPVVACAVLGDGHRVVSASWDATLRIWNTQGQKSVYVTKGHTGAVLAVVALDDCRVISASADSTLRIWNTQTGESENTLVGHTGPVLACAVLGTNRIVSASHDNTLRLWNLQTGSTEKILRGHCKPVVACAVLSDGRVVSASRDGTLRIWNTDSGQSTHILTGHSHAVVTCAVLNDDRVVSISVDSTRVWDSQTGELIHSVQSGSELRTCVVLDECRVISTWNEFTLRVWNTQTGQAEQRLGGHSNSVRVCAKLDGDRLVSGADEYSLRVWNLRSGKTEHLLRGHLGRIEACVVMSNGHHFVSASHDKTLRLWDANTGYCLGIALDIPAVSLAAVGDCVIAGCRDGNVWFFRVHELASQCAPPGTWFRQAFARRPSVASPLEQAREFLLQAFKTAELRQLVELVDSALATRIPDHQLTTQADVVEQLLQQLKLQRGCIAEFVRAVRALRPKRDDLDVFEESLRALATRQDAPMWQSH